MSKKSVEAVYDKILKQRERFEPKIDFEKQLPVPTPDEIEAILLWMNKEKLPHA
jgi:hypothetical protein|tara:strand:- start:314 stop:475 length:162 start_codon:yes stop_codon:yes gene_type:complete